MFCTNMCECVYTCNYDYIAKLRSWRSQDKFNGIDNSSRIYIKTYIFVSREHSYTELVF